MVKGFEVLEVEPFKVERAKVVEGFPDVGLVGAIATSHLVDLMAMEVVAYVESDLLPPIMVLHRGKLQSPIRIYGRENLLVIVSEIAIPPELLSPLVKTVCDWLKKKNIELLISLGGIAVPNRMEIDNPTVYGIANSVEASNLLKYVRVELMEEGFVVGAYALFLKEAMKRSIPAVALLAQSYAQYPDPGAAAAVINVFGKVAGRTFDVKPLLDRAEEIRIRTRDLMKQARAAIVGMNKSRESELPLMYH